MFNLLDYGTKIEAVLRQKAELAGLHSNSGDAGAARELFLREFLSRFLPRTIVVGRGEVVGAEAHSRQQDIVLYRANFPVIQTLGESALYLAEGVLATIEVKTHLDAREVGRVAENVASVRSVKPSPLGVAIDEERSLGGSPISSSISPMSPSEAMRRLAAGISPGHHDPLLDPPEERIRTYAVAFHGASDSTLNTALGDTEASGLPDCTVVLGQSVGMRTDDFGIPSRDSYTLISNPSPLGWLVAHLWRGVFGRPRRLPVLRPYLGNGG